ncbi:MAG: hypothetical protein RL660_2978 [Bacteroidota bacterium]|jgi:hypothetical protein
MKKLFFIAAALLLAQFSQAQDAKDIVKWQAGITNVEADNATFVVLSANIAKGWHIFTSNPGGDGFAIPTSIVLVSGKDSIVVNDRMANMKVISKDIEGMGTMNYFEGNLVYKILLTQPLAKGSRLYITYQCCNDKMCLPPTDVVLDVK